MGRILAVDPGTKRTGLAISDASGALALALPLLEMSGDDTRDAGRIVEIAAGQGAERIVVGLPVNMDGTEGPRALAVRGLIDEIANQAEVPVEAWDERMTTVEGEGRLRSIGLSRKERSKRTDTAAAIVILESYLRAKGRRP